MPKDLPRDEALESWLSAQFRDRIRFFAARRLRDATVAEDAAQETLRRVLEALRADRLRDPDALPGFVFETARHVCMHWNRSGERESRAYQQVSNAPAQESLREDPLRDLITEERRALVRRALDQLSPDDRHVLVLTYEAGLASDEIARELNLSAGAVRVRRHRALGRLAELLDVTSGRQRGPQ